MPKPKDYYKILGVSSKSTTKQIKSAYRKLAKRYHPDLNQGDKRAEAKFKDIAEAYDILGNIDKRKKYDQIRTASRFGFDFGGTSKKTYRRKRRTSTTPTGTVDNEFDLSNFDFSKLGEMFNIGDIFSNIFDKGQGVRQEKYPPKKGDDIYQELEIPFEMSIKGGKITVAVPREEPCPQCRGTGAQPGTKTQKCSVCKGRGTISDNKGTFAVSRPCPRCEGRGYIIGIPCTNCRGQGQILKKRKIKLKIAAGTHDGSKIRLNGQGELGSAGGATGDLIFTIRIGKHRFFRREGWDIYCTIPINIVQALLGSKIRVRTLGGNKVVVTIPSGSSGGTKLKLKGLGVEKKDGTRGDQYILLEIKVPDDLTSKQKELIEEFAKEGEIKY